MPIINRRNPEILASYKGKGLLYLTLRTKDVYFPKQVCHALKLNKGDLIHFWNEGDQWCFYKNNNDKDGFPLTYDKGYKISNRALARMMIKSLLVSVGTRLMFVKSTSVMVAGAEDGVYELQKEFKVK